MLSGLLLALSPVAVRSLEASSLQKSGFPDYYRFLSDQEVRDGVARFVLKNGVTVLIEEYPLYPIASVVTFIDTAGPSDVATGAARELTEIDFRISARRLDSMSHRYGQNSRAEKTSEALIYSSVVPEEGVFRALEAHVALLDPLEFSASEFDAHLSSVRRSQREKVGSDDPLQPAFEELDRLFAPARSASLPAEGGSVADPEGLQKLHSRLYQPRNVVLSISGFVRHEQILGKIVELYVSRPAGESSGVQGKAAGRSAQQRDSEEGSFRYVHLRGDIDEAHVLLIFPVSIREPAEYTAFLLLRSLLAGGTPPLLEATLKERGSAPYRVEVLSEERGGRTLFIIKIAARADQVDAAEADVLGWLQLLGEEGIPPSELNRARALLLTEIYLSLQQTTSRAVYLARQQMLGKFWERARLPLEIAALKASTLQKFVERFLKVNRLTILEWFPRKADARTFTAQSLRETLEILLPEVVERKSAVLHQRNVSIGESDWKLESFQPSFVKGDFVKTSILRGPEVLLQEVHTTPIAQLGIFYYGGRIEETAETSGLTELLLRSLLHSFRRTDRIQEWLRLEQWGGSLQAVNEPDFFGFQTTLLSPGLAGSLRLVTEWLRNASVEESDVEAARDELLQELQTGQESPENEMMQAARSQFFTGHPYGLPPRGSPENLKTFDVEAVRNWQSRMMSQVHPFLLVRGDLEGTSFLKGLAADLGEARFRRSSPVPKKFEAPSRRGRHPYYRHSRETGSLFVFEGPAAGSFPDVALDVLEKILNGPAGLLHSNLHKKGLWGTPVELRREDWLNGGAIYVLFDVKDSEVETLEKVTMESFEELTRRPSPDPEMLNAMVAAITDFYRFQQGGPEFLAEAMEFISAVREKEAFQNYISTIRQMSHEDLVAVTGAFLAGIEPANRAAGEEN